MNSLMKKAGLGVALAATALTAAAPADAQRYRGDRYYHRGGNGTGTAVVAGIAGLAIGAALASNNRDRYYDRGYRGGGYNRGYYDRGYNGYYDRGYYPQRGYYRGDGYRDRGYRNGGYYRECRIERRWDPYYGRSAPVRVCY